ncbi:hypothetical protein [Bradyrhizobium cenepequi]
MATNNTGSAPQAAVTAAELEKLARDLSDRNMDEGLWVPHRDYLGDTWSPPPAVFGGTSGGAMPGPNRAASSKPDRFTPNGMQAMICSRMGWRGMPDAPFKVLEARKLSAEQAVVFVIVEETALLIHDDLNLFPSDALVTQLRLLVL